MTRRFSDSTNSYYDYDTDGGDSEYYSDIEEDTLNEETRIVVKVDNIPIEMEDRAILELIGSGLGIETKRKNKLSKMNKKTQTRSIEVIVPDQETLREVIRRGNQTKLGKKYLQVFDYDQVQSGGINNFVFVFGINTRSETKIRNHFSQYGDILSIFQRDECSAKIQFYSKEQQEKALRNKEAMSNQEKITVQDSPITESVSLFILSISAGITQNHILQTLSLSSVHPISISFNSGKATCILTFKNRSDLISASRCLLTNFVQKQNLMFSIFGEKLPSDERKTASIRNRMIESNIPTTKIEKIIRRLTPYQISFLTNHKNTLNIFPDN